MIGSVDLHKERNYRKCGWTADGAYEVNFGAKERLVRKKSDGLHRLISTNIKQRQRYILFTKGGDEGFCKDGFRQKEKDKI